MIWRGMIASDLPGVRGLAEIMGCDRLDDIDRAYGLGGPAFCRVLVEDRHLFGFVVSHPWDDGVPTYGRDETFAMLTSLYVTAIGIHASRRGRGLGGAVVHDLIECARKFGYSHMRFAQVPMYRMRTFGEQSAEGFIIRL